LIRYRPFLNTDPPAIAELWRNQSPHRGLAQPMTANQLDNKVLCKPYFDRQGFIVAEEDDKLVGFVHCCVSEQPSGEGAVCLLLVGHHEQKDEIAAQLLSEAQDYLSGRGVTKIAFGGVDGANPFYLGFYGGSVLSGALVSDAELLQRLQAAGFEETSRSTVLQCELANFRPVIDRWQVQVRRVCQIESQFDPPSETWWRACTTGFTEQTRFQMSARQTGDPWGSVTYWEMRPLAESWGVHAVALSHLTVLEEHRREGRATFLVGESMRQLATSGVSLVEVNVAQTNEAALALFQKLGFRQVDEAVEMCKELP